MRYLDSRMLTVFPAEAFNELLGNKEEKAMIKPVTTEEVIAWAEKNVAK